MVRATTARTIALERPLNRALRRVISRFDIVSILFINNQYEKWG